MFPKNLDSKSVIPQTIIFVDERRLAFRVMRVLREFLPPELRKQVEIYHALQSQIAKDLTAKRFENGEIRILICTEALTMGCDFKRVEQVVMLKVPGSAATVLQRGGRSGRDESIQARVVMMVEASKRAQAIADLVPELASTEPMKTKTEDEDESLEPIDLEDADHGSQGDEEEAAVEAIKVAAAEHGKEDQAILQKFYAPTDDCRTLVLDAAFDSPPHAPCISVNGCDNCIRRRIRQLEEKLKGETHGDSHVVKKEPTDDPNALVQTIEGLRALLIEPQVEDSPKKPIKRAKYRKMDERSELEKALKRWRGEIYESELKKLGVHTDYIVTDRTLKAIAKIPPPVTLESLSTVSPMWPEKARTRWAPSLLAKVEEYDLPNCVVERQVERVRVKEEKAKAKKGEEGAQIIVETQEGPGMKTRKRRPAPDDAPKSTPAKKTRIQPADSALSAEGSSGPAHKRLAGSTTKASTGGPSTVTSTCSIDSATHGLLRNTPKPLRTAVKPHSTETPPAANLFTTPKTMITPMMHTASTSQQHYRPHTYNPTLMTQDIDFSTAKPIGTRSIPARHIVSQVTNQPSTPNAAIPEASTSSVAPRAIAPAIQNPQANRNYYKREDLWR
ncbi:ATP-dependent DNA helicase sgs1 [Ceratobasidium sp. 428]|nr:ATP-dependent DNA helicase sgs1 [Ceratobasidium sp. 428]